MAVSWYRSLQLFAARVLFPDMPDPRPTERLVVGGVVEAPGWRHRFPHPMFYVEDGEESATGPRAGGAPLGPTRRRCVRSWKRCSTT
jgi:hypothetical protein